MSLHKRLARVDFRLDCDRGGVCTQEIRKRRLYLALFIIASTAFVTRGQCGTVLFTITIRHWPQGFNAVDYNSVFLWFQMPILSSILPCFFCFFAIFMNRGGWCCHCVYTSSNSGIAPVFLLRFVGTHVRGKNTCRAQAIF